MAYGDASTMLWHDKTRFLANEEEVKVDAIFLFLPNLLLVKRVLKNLFIVSLTFNNQIKF